jgi:uncharacterized protein
MLVLLAGILAACSSPPSNYYVLSAQPDPVRPMPAGFARTTVAIGAIMLPGALDRPQIARRLGPNQLDYTEYDRWAGPLDEMIRRVLAADLRSRLPEGTVLIDNGSLASADLTIAIDIRSFDADKSGRVTLNASWEILNKNTKVVGIPSDAIIVESPAGSDTAAVAATMSRAVAALAGNIGSDIRREATAAIRCWQRVRPPHLCAHWAVRSYKHKTLTDWGPTRNDFHCRNVVWET